MIFLGMVTYIIKLQRKRRKVNFIKVRQVFGSDGVMIWKGPAEVLSVCWKYSVSLSE